MHASLEEGNLWNYEENHAEKYGAIHSLEAINLLVAYKSLAPKQPTPGLRVVIYTDNISSAYSLMSGKTRDCTLGACARQMCLEAASCDYQFTISHKHPS